LAADKPQLAALLGHNDFTFDDSDDVRDAVSLLIVAMAVEDGELAQDEQVMIGAILRNDPLFKGDEDLISGCLERAIISAQDDDQYGNRLIKALETFTTTPAREVVAAMILSVVAADGVEDVHEADFGTLLMERLLIDSGRVQEIYEQAVIPFADGLFEDD